jgi:hypothetical protein
MSLHFCSEHVHFQDSKLSAPVRLDHSAVVCGCCDPPTTPHPTGAGDFVQHLMDILAPELDKRAERIFAHNMMGFIQQAARASNAQVRS